MIKIYIMAIRQLEEETVFGRALETVSSGRRQKTERLKQEKDKRRSLAAAIALDCALKEYGLRERDMEYDLTPQGKPCLRYRPDLHFSLSHAGEYAVCSIGPRANGSDIERIRSGKERVAQRFFTPEENEWIQKASSQREREERIFRIWTMKESFLKVTGCGMSLPLDSFSFLLEEDGTVGLRQSFDQKKYFIKEYDITSVFKEETEYKIAACSESPVFSERLRQVFFP